MQGDFMDAARKCWYVGARITPGASERMYLFGTTGLAAAGDGCFFIGMIAGLVGTALAAAAGMMRRSPGWSALSALGAALFGFIVLLVMFQPNPSPNDEDLHDQRMMSYLVAGWIGTTALMIGSFVSVWRYPHRGELPRPAEFPSDGLGPYGQSQGD